MSESNGMQPDITIIVPTYNVSDYLDQALRSIREQTLANLEIICINDGSTDDSLSIMQRHAAEDARIKIIDKANEGYGASCNRGIDEAQGRYLAIVEPDDWIESGMYADMIDSIDGFDQRIDIVKTPYWRVLYPDTPQEYRINCSYRNRIHPPAQPFTIDQAAHLLSHHPSIWSAIYRLDFLNEHRIRFKPIPGAGWADNPFLIETLCQAETIVYLDQPYYCYREETPEKSKSFALNNTLLPFARWNDMTDVLERLGVTDEAVLRAHNSRGFTYLGGVLEEVDLSNEDLAAAATQMFSRMDDALVFSDDEIPPASKRLYASLLGLPEPSVKKGPYLASLFRQGLYNLKNTGFKHTFATFTKYLRNRKARSGSA